MHAVLALLVLTASLAAVQFTPGAAAVEAQDYVEVEVRPDTPVANPSRSAATSTRRTTEPSHRRFIDSADGKLHQDPFPCHPPGRYTYQLSSKHLLSRLVHRLPLLPQRPSRRRPRYPFHFPMVRRRSALLLERTHHLPCSLARRELHRRDHRPRRRTQDQSPPRHSGRPRVADASRGMSPSTIGPIPVPFRPWIAAEPANFATPVGRHPLRPCLLPESGTRHPPRPRTRRHHIRHLFLDGADPGADPSAKPVCSPRKPPVLSLRERAHGRVLQRHLGHHQRWHLFRSAWWVSRWAPI